jgi:hypothetical protein
VGNRQKTEGLQIRALQPGVGFEMTVEIAGDTRQFL